MNEALEARASCVALFHSALFCLAMGVTARPPQPIDFLQLPSPGISPVPGPLLSAVLVIHPPRLRPPGWLFMCHSPPFVPAIQPLPTSPFLTRVPFPLSSPSAPLCPPLTSLVSPSTA